MESEIYKDKDIKEFFEHLDEDVNENLDDILEALKKAKQYGLLSENSGGSELAQFFKNDNLKYNILETVIFESEQKFVDELEKIGVDTVGLKSHLKGSDSYLMFDDDLCKNIENAISENYEEFSKVSNGLKYFIENEMGIDITRLSQCVNRRS